MRDPSFLTCLILLCLASACGGESDPAADDPAEGAAPYREQIDPAREAKVAKRTLDVRDTPLAVGESGPSFDALPVGRPTVVVFYRGHW